VLKPDTNSDSASLKSNGARCVSAKVQTNQIGKKKEKKKEDKEYILLIENEHVSKTARTRIVVKTDS
jgi:hypothetical protein